ncbi:MAG: HypC/HybG/HupF family hydrogenase formation chaperone, partial [Corynebacterium sp.]|nr:HypC/HybG/HupF family hydrogenase formation chaperone [Corynebacterium sp.]
GTARECCLAYVPEARVGDYVLIQNGFAMDVIDEPSARASLEAIAELGLAPDPASGD